MMGWYLSWFKRKDPRTPVKGCIPRIKNIALTHFRGLLGTLVPIIILSLLFQKGKKDVTVICLWLIMFWTMLVQPMAVPATGFLPIFVLPVSRILKTHFVCANYFNDSVCLFILRGSLQLLLNTSGFDRRMILWLLCSGNNGQFTGKRLVFKASTAAFFLSMFSNRMIITSTITQYLTPGYMNLQTATSKRKTEPDYDEMRYIVLNAVQSASTIGSVTILHAALTPLAMKAIWTNHPGYGNYYTDIFNYFQYTCFAFPVAFCMFIFNSMYHMVLVNIITRRPMSGNSMSEIRNFLLKQKESLPSFSYFDTESVFFYVLFLLACFFRWSEWLPGWSEFGTTVPGVPMVRDATVAAIFLIGLSILPRRLSIWKYIAKKKKSELGTLKPESAILWWRFADINTHYGYILLIGGAVALNNAIISSNLGPVVAAGYGKYITDLNWNISILVTCLLSIILANIMTGIAGCCMFLPFVLNMALEGAGGDWTNRGFLGALGVGIGTSMGFTYPFLYTPAYFCHYNGKVPIKKMIVYGIGSAIICLVILWLSLCYYGPIIWSRDLKSFRIPKF